ncbi:MAG: hypothetical protein JSV52_03435 [Candidatus Zixiibacteriota bacterium]|nr:MAG: hypothetical protein JSV52_03435 [candidate division Zixibacteria bacterium]
MYGFTKAAAALFVMLVLVILGGCIDYEEHLVLNRDGSGTIQMKYAVDKAYLNQLKEMYEQMAQAVPEMDIPDDPSETMFDKAHIETVLSDENSRVKLVHYEKSENENSQLWDMKFAFQDINNIEYLGDALSPEDEYENEYGDDNRDADEEVIHMLVKQDDGTLLFYRPLDDYNSGREDEELYYDDYGDDYGDDYSDYDEVNGGAMGELGQQMDEGVRQLGDHITRVAEGMENHDIVFRVTFPGDILESNATRVEGRTAIWQYKLGELNGEIPAQKAIIRP